MSSTAVLPSGQSPAPRYVEDVIRAAVILTMFWGIAAFLVGVVIAAQLVWPQLSFDSEYITFGRLRPLHTSAAIFAFGGTALIGTAFHIVQRTCRARLFGGAPLGWFVLLGYQFFIVIAATGYLLGISQSKEYAEPEWYADLWLTVVWVAYLIAYLGTVLKREEPHIYVANWFYLAFIVTVAMLHIVNNLAMPVSIVGTKSYGAWSGVQDAMIQWWYGHNAVGFFLTAAFLGMMYYYIPKAANRPVYSYRLSIVHFWSLVFMYIWAGPHHLHYTSLPDWAQTPLLTAIYRSCGSILVHHEDVKAELVSTFPVDPARVSVVPLWATPHWTSDEPRTLGAPPVVLFQGSLRKNKGVDVLLDAIGRLADSDLRFVIAGRGDAGVEERVRAAAAANDRLTAEIGWVTPERKQELLVGCDLVVMPYTSFASQSAVLHDAYGAHVPVVGTEVGALGASIRADGTGRSVEPSDAVGLAEAISGLLGDPEEWARCSAASRRMGIERSPEAFGRGLRGVYTETIAAFGK